MKICVQKKAGRRKRASRLFFLLPMVPCASSPVTRVLRSPMWEQRRAWERSNSGMGCQSTLTFTYKKNAILQTDLEISCNTTKTRGRGVLRFIFPNKHLKPKDYLNCPITFNRSEHQKCMYTVHKHKPFIANTSAKRSSRSLINVILFPCRNSLDT